MKLRTCRAGWVLAACLLLEGCAGGSRTAIPGNPVPPAIPPPIQRCDAGGVLAYFERVRGLTSATQEEELESARKAFQSTGQNCDRFRLAMLLLLPDPRLRDEPVALKLLGDYLEGAGPENEGLRPLARLQVSAIRRAWECENRQKELARKLEDERAKAENLKRQLDALKDIERIMNERQKK